MRSKRYIAHMVLWADGSNVTITDSSYRNLEQFKRSILKEYQGKIFDYLSFEEVLVDELNE